MDWIVDPQNWIGLVTLTSLEIVLGIDNVVFISILSGKLPPEIQGRARKVGLMLALVSRILLLLTLRWIMRLTHPLFTVIGTEISGKDLVLIVGGAFLLVKSTREIHERLEGEEHGTTAKARPSFLGVITQIMVLDIVFSLDSVITAVGMVDRVGIMIAAVILAALFMLGFSGPLSVFVEKHPTIKMLALSFLLLIGVNLIAEGLHQHIPKGYTYFAMAFSVFVEMLNLKMRRKAGESVSVPPVPPLPAPTSTLPAVPGK